MREIITPEIVKKYGPADHNYDSKLICPLIGPVQMANIDCLGDEWLEQISTQISSGSISANNKYLLETYIWPMLSWGIVAAGVYPNSIRAANAGNVRLNGHHYEPADLKELAAVKHSYESFVNAYKTRLIKEIESHPDKYPLYPAHLSNCAEGCTDTRSYAGIIGIENDEIESNCNCKDGINIKYS